MQITLVIRTNVANVEAGQDLTDKIMEILKDIPNLVFSSSISDQLKTIVEPVTR